MSYPRFSIHEVGGFCPCQVHGYVMDRVGMEGSTYYAFYFRARHGFWSITVGPVNEMLDEKYDLPKDPSELVAEGNDPDHGWMDPTDAVALVKEYLGAWFTSKHPEVDRG